MVDCPECPIVVTPMKDNTRLHLLLHLLAILVVFACASVVIWRYVGAGTATRLGLCALAFVAIAYAGHHWSPKLLGPLIERFFPTRQQR
jgi:uncharacterized membrane protein YwzB